jgi:hypothetical protein
VLLVFGDYVIDSERRELRQGADPVAAEPRSSISWCIWCNTAIGWSARTTCCRRYGADGSCRIQRSPRG